MQPQAPPMTPFEQRATQAFHAVGALRAQSVILHRSAAFCMDRCLDTEELYTLLRTTQAPIRYRLDTDLAEKKCTANCSAKWDELYRATAMRVNEEETRSVQMREMNRMMEAMQRNDSRGA
ncbi:hypothetical protein ERJ75_001443500 [Trypanosoma vivax]|uniref:Tim10-like domain-containing protein n=1 Tax=Trypanosoma vivax (strain Y486) TaxID=1055687 RepID=G0U866_TRYVY|nr:hypothetical protein TRVL_03199 [Trypanosoma vivax]KAH8607315.1 hypothetical protein ERJ75_001443500 [Trypanosoma vivax]CCC52075.1 conserved hypothetical protein [Trypanosoma vivax Y486]